MSESRRIRNAEDLARVAESGMAGLHPDRLKIMVGSASCGIALGAREIEAEAARAVRDLGLDAVVSRAGCIGFCSREPLMDLLPPDGPRISYAEMTPQKTRQVLEAYASGGTRIGEAALCRYEREEFLLKGEARDYPDSSPDLDRIPVWSELDFHRRQKRVILRNCGSIDPMSIEETIARGTYGAALRALTRMTPESTLDEVVRSGLRGRGGAAFPTGQKWRFARQAAGDVKYLICNADEGEPAAYMDRTVLEGDPHAVLEGMLIGSHAVGAHQGYIYVRSEYPLAVALLEHAIAEAERHGLLGDDIFGSGWSFRVSVRRGAGAYVCGEETALIESIEGRAGEPRPRPPFPAERGLWGKPTVVNNVKTWASIAPIIARGSGWYAAMGTRTTPGTTVFSLEGAVRNAGLVEVPFGLTLREMVHEIGGGMSGNRPLKALQAGGASRGCLPPSMLDLRIDSEDRAGQTTRMGTGGIVVLDDRACMVDMVRFLVEFFREESCGKCTSCREGALQILGILDRICRGDGTQDDPALLERLAGTVGAVSTCGLGNMMPEPVLAALRNFPQEFDAHIRDQRCPAGVCRMGTE